MTYLLQRLSESDEGIFGELRDPNGIKICCTAELPWRGNQHLISCIPAGTAHQVIPHNSPEHPHTWEIRNVPNRTGILIHEGNLPLKDSLGCIIVGMRQGFIETQMAVLESVAAINLLRKQLPPTFELVIFDVLPPF